MYYRGMPRKKLPDHLRRPPGRPQVYPWERWFNGESHILEPSVDFDCQPTSLRTQIYHRAKADGLVVRVMTAHDRVVVKADRSKARDGSSVKYDWDKLLDGETHTLNVGVDLTAKPSSFRVYARNVAKERDLSLQIRQIGDQLILRARPRRTGP